MISNERNFAMDYYGDQFRWFFGVVEDINDPMKLGRVRVRVKGVHSYLQSDIGTGDLPWAQVELSTTEGGVSGIGRSTGLKPNALVMGFFLDGKASQLPMIIAVIPKVETSSAQQNSRASDPRIDRTRLVTGPGHGITGTRAGIEPMANVNMSELGNNNVEQSYNFFIEAGFSPMHSAAIIGNLQAESTVNLDTSVGNYEGEASYGIAQWYEGGGRLQQLKAFADERGRPWTDLEIQLKFILWELETQPYLGLREFQACTNLECAVRVFETKYERPEAGSYNARLQNARAIYARYN